MGITLGQLALILGFSVCMAVGQIGFKIISRGLTEGQSLAEAALILPMTASFWIVGMIYGLSMVYWVWLLTRVPLNIAYPISSASLILVPVIAWMLFGEPIGARYFLGILLIVAGIALVAQQ